jgi:hypothetical protein
LNVYLKIKEEPLFDVLRRTRTPSKCDLLLNLNLSEKTGGGRILMLCGFAAQHQNAVLP